MHLKSLGILDDDGRIITFVAAKPIQLVERYFRRANKILRVVLQISPILPERLLRRGYLFIPADVRCVFRLQQAEFMRQAGASRSETKSDGGLVGGLLKIVGIDPTLLSSGAKSAAEPGVAPVESAAEAAPADSPKDAADETSVADAEESAKSHRAEAKTKAVASTATHAAGQPPSPPPLVERRLRVAAESSRESAGKDDQRRGGDETPGTSVTVVVQIIEQPKPVETDKPAKAKPDRSKASKVIK